VAQTVVARRLEAKVEPIFHPDSYGYRPRRSALAATLVTSGFVGGGIPLASARRSAPTVVGKEPFCETDRDGIAVRQQEAAWTLDVGDVTSHANLQRHADFQSTWPNLNRDSHSGQSAISLRLCVPSPARR
jgi:hypothetical protein